MRDHLWQNPSLGPGLPLVDGQLGGTATNGDHNSWFPELWDWLIERFAIKSMLDVGCGVGHCQNFFRQRGVDAYALEGSALVLKHHVNKRVNVALHNLNDCPLVMKEGVDLVWCCEVAEHVEEQFVQNVVDTVTNNARKVLAFCAAPPSAKYDNHNHVNCQPESYWIKLITAQKLKYSEQLTVEARSRSPHRREGREVSYFYRSGLIFTKEI